MRGPRRQEALGALGGAVLMLLFGVVVHEATHYYIFQAFGCESTFRLLGGYIRAIPAADCYAALPAGATMRLRQAQLAAEAVGYQLVPLYLLTGGAVGAELFNRTR